MRSRMGFLMRWRRPFCCFDELRLWCAVTLNLWCRQGGVLGMVRAMMGWRFVTLSVSGDLDVSRTALF